MTKKILIIENETDIIDNYRYWLEKAGYTVFEAKNGAAGIQRYLDKKPDLVLLDVMMPGMDGLAALEQIKTKDPQAAVIMLSNLEDEARQNKARELGALEYLIKGRLLPSQVVDKIKKHIA